MYRLLEAFYGAVWALEPEMYDAMARVIERWSTGVRLTELEIREAIGGEQQIAAMPAVVRMGAGGGPAPTSGPGAVAVVPVYGVLTHRAYTVANSSTPMTSTEALVRTLRSFHADPDVGSIVLDMRTPGGDVQGVQEAGEAIHAMSARQGGKRIVAVANAVAASGGYWLASQADELVVTPSGAVGSIGVITSHTDRSALQEKLGERREYITAGRHKAEGNDAGPLSPEARAFVQKQVDTYYNAFVKAVARGRNVGIDVVRGETFGEGRTLLAKDAVAAGMADRIDTLDNVIAGLQRMRAKRPAGGLSASAAALQVAVAERSQPIL